MGPLGAYNYAKRLRQTLAWEVRYGYTIDGARSQERERWGKTVSSRWMWTEAFREQGLSSWDLCNGNAKHPTTKARRAVRTAAVP